MHWGVNKLTDILQTTFSSNAFLWLKFLHLVQISLKFVGFVHRGPIHNKSALVHVMAWHRLGIHHYMITWWPSSVINEWITRPQRVNSLAPGRPRWHFKTAIFNLVLLIGSFTSSKDNALRWMPWDLTDDKSTLVQVMAWCRQATSHYLSQCWPSPMSPYGVTRPQRVKQFLRWYMLLVIKLIVAL